MFKRIAYALTGLVLSSVIALGANLPLIPSNPNYSDPSQIIPTLNFLVQSINAGVEGSLGGFVGPQATTGTTIQVLGTATIPASSLSNGQAVRVVCWGTGTATGTNTLTIQVGTNTAFAVAGGATTAGVFRATVYIQKTGSSTQSIWSDGVFNTTATTPVITAGTQTDTSPIPVTCSGTSTTSTNFTLNGMIAEQIK
jgi:hypothetical protein